MPSILSFAGSVLLGAMSVYLGGRLTFAPPRAGGNSALLSSGQASLRLSPGMSSPQAPVPGLPDASFPQTVSRTARWSNEHNCWKKFFPIYTNRHLIEHSIGLDWTDGKLLSFCHALRYLHLSEGSYSWRYWNKIPLNICSLPVLCSYWLCNIN